MSQSDEQGWLEEFREEIDPPVFWAGAIISIVFILGYYLAPTKAGTDKNYVAWMMISINDWLWTNLTWYYLLAMFIFVVFSVFLIVGPWGNIKIGGEDAEPKHSFFNYFAIFFSAGIAAGIEFWGPAEGLIYFGSGTPLGKGAAASTQTELMIESLTYTFFHWGISAWCAYLIVGVPIAYYAYNMGAPFRFSTLLTPFIGVDNLDDSNVAKVVDIIAVFATIGGVATSLGFVGQQLISGLNYKFDAGIGSLGQFVLIAALTVIFTISVISGVKRGIKRLSQVNVTLFLILGTATFVFGFPVLVLNLGTQAIGMYIDQFIHLSFFTGASMTQHVSGIAGQGPTIQSFVGSWTVFYWAWWFSWAPFAGIFLARISKGRTIREIAFTGVISTTLATIPWFLVMGTTAMKLQAIGAADILGAVNQFGPEVSGYPLFATMPFGTILSILFFILIITFFVTSADSSTLSLAMLTTGGKENPSGANRLFWGVIQGIVAGILVYIGGTNALQQAAIITGAPVAIIGLIGIWGMIKVFSRKHGRVLVQEGVTVGGDTIIPGGGSTKTDSSGTNTSEDD